MSSNGYIKIHRSMMDWEWYQDDRCVRLLLHLHLKVNYKDKRWKGHEVKAGQIITSTVKLAEELVWSRSAVNRTLDKLKASGEVDTKANSKWTLVTLIKWDKFQQNNEEPDTNPDNKRTTSGHQTGQQADTTKESKERKKEKKEKNKEILLSEEYVRTENVDPQAQVEAALNVEIWPTFNDWWDLYDKKIDHKACERKWNKLSQKERVAAHDHTELYIRAAGADKNYRRNPSTYLNNQNWNDEQLTIPKKSARGTSTLEEKQRAIIEDFHRRTGGG